MRPWRRYRYWKKPATAYWSGKTSRPVPRLIEALSHHHGLFHAEAETGAGRLLQGGGDEHLSQDALNMVRGYISDKFGKKYLPESANQYASKEKLIQLLRIRFHIFQRFRQHVHIRRTNRFVCFL
jgi:hypothetical protein